MEKIIYKYIKNELTKEEVEELTLWLEESSANRAVFENIIGHWMITEEDINQSKKKVLQEIKKVQNLPLIEKSKATGPSFLFGDYMMLRVASILLVGTLLSYLFLYITNLNTKETVATVVETQPLIIKETFYGQKKTVTLPDGSVVKLNSGSKISYPEKFTENQRNIYLSGEAFFDVTPDASKPFIVSMDNNLSVKVLGTSFNILSYPNDNEIMVAVKTGKVSVKDIKKEILLKPAELVKYRPKKASFKRGQIDDEKLVFGWTEQNLIFKGHKVNDILKILTRWYNVGFILEKRLPNDKLFTANYDNPSLEKVLKSLSYAYDFKYEINGNEVRIF